MRARHCTSVRSRLQWLYSLTYSAIFPQRLRYPAYVSPAPQQYGELLHRLRETVIFFQLPGLAGLALLALLEDRGVFLSLLLLLLATLPIQLFFLLCFLRVKERQCVLRLLPTPSVPSPRARWTWISPLAAVFPAAPASVVPRIVYTTPVKTTSPRDAMKPFMIRFFSRRSRARSSASSFRFRSSSDVTVLSHSYLRAQHVPLARVRVAPPPSSPPLPSASPRRLARDR